VDPGAGPASPFPVAKIVPRVAAALKVPEGEARSLVDGPLTEVARLPGGRRYFRREGDAAVPLPEFAGVSKTPRAERDAYPYEL
jgi:hypothetical protein